MLERNQPPHLTRATTLTNSMLMSSRRNLMNVYCDVLIGIGKHTRYSRLSNTLKEAVDFAIQSHIEAFDTRIKSVDAHNKYIVQLQEFCKEQM